MSKINELINRARELDSKATPGPYSVVEHNNSHHLISGVYCCGHRFISEDSTKEDAKLNLFNRNNLKTLITIIKAQQEALEKYSILEKSENEPAKGVAEGCLEDVEKLAEWALTT